MVDQKERSVTFVLRIFVGKEQINMEGAVLFIGEEWLSLLVSLKTV